MYMQADEVITVFTDAIADRKILRVQYERVRDNTVVERRKAPFDIGTTNPKYIESHRYNAYMFCYDHIDDKTGTQKQIVHPIRIDKIVSMIDTGERFDENELADVNLRNTGYDYRKCNFAVLPNRDWFKRRP